MKELRRSASKPGERAGSIRRQTDPTYSAIESEKHVVARLRPRQIAGLLFEFA